IPVVLFDRINVDIGMDAVGVNDRGSIYEAVTFLHSKNLSKIALVCGLGEIGLGKQRINGFKEACNDLGLASDKKYILASKDIPEVKKKLKKLLLEDRVEA